MSMILSGGSAISRRRVALPLELLSYSFHTTCVSSRDYQSHRGSARTRLAKDLTPRNSKGKGPGGRLEVAPRPSYQRQPAPHVGRSSSDSRNGTRGGPPRRTDSNRSRSNDRSFDRGDRPKPSADFQRKERSSGENFRQQSSSGEHVRQQRSYGGSPRQQRSSSGFPGRQRSSSESYGQQRSSDAAPRQYRSSDESPRQHRSPDRFPRQQRSFDESPRQYRSSPSYSRDKPPGSASSTHANSLAARRGPLATNASEKQPPQVSNPLADEFDINTKLEPAQHLPSEFTSPPLMDGLLNSLHDVLGVKAKPTPIQALSIKHLLSPPSNTGWREYLLASETGSGKSFAYMLPMLQDLKTSELNSQESEHNNSAVSRLINPRAIVLAPTHELTRQLSGMAKSLLHNIKLRVISASQANTSLKAPKHLTASKLATLSEDGLPTQSATAPNVHRPVDVLVGTTSKVLEMVRGHGWNWDKVRQESEESLFTGSRKQSTFVVGEPEVGLKRVEWVVVDEADVLFDPDFKDATRMLLADIAAARGYPVADENTPTSYPFNLLLTSATIPSSLANYLDTHHPDLKRLASPNLHKLPSSLKTEHAPWTGGNRAADVEARIRQTWFGDTTHGSGVRSKVLVFCNKSAKVEEFGKYLTGKGIPNVALTSTADARKRGTNHHLDGFLRTPLPRPTSVDPTAAKKPKSEEEPHVLITTSLLSRGLDFSPEIKNVLIVDPPRNMIDFLHRAGRTGRAGSRGTVVIFGKMKGRGVTKHKDVRRKVNALQ
ncbi:P-loop containing nucleoside triphosphate hydrolase protein [Trametopsis cervina]|nr:P-loop containing nucleoside triphosphate hydrolase protein [Trametopsis cervina]